MPRGFEPGGFPAFGGIYVSDGSQAPRTKKPAYDGATLGHAMRARRSSIRGRVQAVRDALAASYTKREAAQVLGVHEVRLSELLRDFPQLKG